MPGYRYNCKDCENYTEPGETTGPGQAISSEPWCNSMNLSLAGKTNKPPCEGAYFMEKGWRYLKIAKSGQRKFCGWGTVDVVDKSGERIRATDVAKEMPQYMERGAPITLGHTNQVIGKIDSWKLKKAPCGNDGIYICGHIFDHYAVDDKVWKAMKDGKLAMLSIGGDITKRKPNCEGGQCFIDLVDPQPYEYAVVPSGMNQESHIDYVASAAKSDDQPREAVLRVRKSTLSRVYAERAERQAQKVKVIVDGLVQQVRRGTLESLSMADNHVENLKYYGEYMEDLLKDYRQELEAEGAEQNKEATKMEKLEEYVDACPYCPKCGAGMEASGLPSPLKACVCPECGFTCPTIDNLEEDGLTSWRGHQFKRVAKAQHFCRSCPSCGSVHTAQIGESLCECQDCLHQFEATVLKTRKSNRSDSLNIKVKQYLGKRKAEGQPRPDAWSMVTKCGHCRRFVEDFVREGRGDLAKAVAELDSRLDDLYGGKEAMENGEVRKQTGAPALRAMVQEMSARLDAIEKALKPAQKEVAPTPAPQEKQECPPGMRWDDAAGKCVEAQPAPAEQKTAAPSPEVEKLVQEAVNKALQAKGVVVSETPRPALAKQEMKAATDGERVASPAELAEQRKRRRANALV